MSKPSCGICLDRYGENSITFDCQYAPGTVKDCPYHLCEVEPPEDHMDCVWHQYGRGCTSNAAKIRELKLLLDFGRKTLKDLEEEARHD